ncbi:hypothetical protein ABVK25_011568 [Lepraria finkii]|uniref:SRP9 domain-containing protein n=1 Tax=Lepraria finkii TaxID=1340010 RepID=A0ABR4ALW9_9LECA
MPYLPTAQSFLEQSRLLISARPTTTRITTKYTLPKKSKTPSSSLPSTEPSKPSQPYQPQPPKATLTLKTYDPISGTCLKYETDKAAEVGRLVAALGSCGRVMAALPAKEEGADEGAMEVDAPVENVEGKAKAVPKEKEVKGGQGQGQEHRKGRGEGWGRRRWWEEEKKGEEMMAAFTIAKEKLLRMQSEHCIQVATELALHIPKIPSLDALPAHLTRSTIL